jgi:hypothetical protein
MVSQIQKRKKVKIRGKVAGKITERKTQLKNLIDLKVVQKPNQEVVKIKGKSLKVKIQGPVHAGIVVKRH